MALRKISDSYAADDGGLKSLGSSSRLGAASLDAANSLAGGAGAVGRGKYEAARSTVTAGWANERRAGAVVREVAPDGRDARDAILLRVAESMRVRNP